MHSPDILYYDPLEKGQTVTYDAYLHQLAQSAEKYHLHNENKRVYTITPKRLCRKKLTRHLRIQRCALSIFAMTKCVVLFGCIFYFCFVGLPTKSILSQRVGRWLSNVGAAYSQNRDTLPTFECCSTLILKRFVGEFSIERNVHYGSLCNFSKD